MTEKDFTIYHQPSPSLAAKTFNLHLFSKAVGGLRSMIIVLLLLSLTNCKTPVAQKSMTIEYDAKIDSILALMTLEEKIGQMTLFTTDWGSTGPVIR